MRVAAQAADLQVAVAGVQRVAQSGRGLCRALETSIRIFQALQASWSASLRASAARSAATRIELPNRYSRDLVVILYDRAIDGASQIVKS